MTDRTGSFVFIGVDAGPNLTGAACLAADDPRGPFEMRSCMTFNGSEQHLPGQIIEERICDICERLRGWLTEMRGGHARRDRTDFVIVGLGIPSVGKNPKTGMARAAVYGAAWAEVRRVFPAARRLRVDSGTAKRAATGFSDADKARVLAVLRAQLAGFPDAMTGGRGLVVAGAAAVALGAARLYRDRLVMQSAR